MRARTQRLVDRIGFRGLGLLTFACTCFLYGTGLLTDYHPTFFSAYGLSTRWYGWGFILVGVVSLTGAPLREDRFHYAFGTMCIASWVLLLATHWTQPGGWAASVSWMSVCGAMVIAASWPEPVHYHEHHPGESPEAGPDPGPGEQEDQ